MSAPEYIAAPDTVLGLLQRGRGEGYRRVLGLPKAEAQELLIRCITTDPRLDWLVESRCEYYAWIAIAIDLPLEPLAEYLRRNDGDTEDRRATALTIDIIAQLAKRDYESAREILFDYIQWGEHWDSPLYDLLHFPDDELIQRVARAVEQHFPADDALDRVMQEHFVILSRFSSRIGASLSRMPKVAVEHGLPNLTSLSPSKLLDLADQKDRWPLKKVMAEIAGPSDLDFLASRVKFQDPFVADVALAGIAKIAPASLLDWLSQLWLTAPERDAQNPSNRAHVIFRRGISRAIVCLPAEATLSLARDWIAQPDSKKQELAELLFQEHATAEDIPILRKSLLPMLTDEDAEWGCWMITAFYNLPSVGVIQELVDIFHHFRFSFGRYYAVKAIQITSPEFFARTLALECLWDCEDVTRELGAKFVPLESAEALQRIRHLAEDPFEEEDVRAAAKARLERITRVQQAG